MQIRSAVRADLPAIVALLADDELGHRREVADPPLDAGYARAFNAIDAARRRGCHLVQLTTDTQRPDALAFYESLGFAVTHQGLKLYLEGDETGR